MILCICGLIVGLISLLGILTTATGNFIQQSFCAVCRAIVVLPVDEHPYNCAYDCRSDSLSWLF